MQISQNFDAGNIVVESSANPADIQLSIRKDQDSEFFQWFYFRLSGARDQSCNINIRNAASAAYPAGFRNYSVLYSYDRREWLRHPTGLSDGILSWQFTPQHDSVYFAYFVPYSMERHHDLIARAQLSTLCEHTVLGNTLDGQDIDLLSFRGPVNNPVRKSCWLIARQHPGESMAEWWMEGIIEKLLDESDEESQKLLANADLHILPNMNPDGSKRGHLRTNAAGRNLNREWAFPSMESSPEVFLVKQAMSETGVDFLLDVHGDESLPYCFIAGTEGLSEWDESRQQQLDFYLETLKALNPDFQTEHGYPVKAKGEANLTMSTGQIAHQHQCLAMTLEMPFKDTTDTPDAAYGWSAERSKGMGHSCATALLAYLESDLI